MGCNMCMVQKPEEQYRVLFQVHSKTLSRLTQENSLDALRSGRDLRRVPRCVMGVAGGAMVTVQTECADSGTQTDISFPPAPPSPPLPPIPEPYLFSHLSAVEHVYYDPSDYFDVSQHEVDRQEEFEYEEVELSRSQQQEKLGLTVCYRTDDEEDLGIYVGEVNPNSIAAKDGRIQEGDRILQINGMDVQSREDAVAILTREDSANISLLLARPDMENDPDELVLALGAELGEELELDNSTHLPSMQRCRRGGGPGLGDMGGVRALWETALSNSQDLDSGLGRTDESTRCEESSEHDLLADEATSSCPTNASNTPGSVRRVRPAHPDFHLSDDSLQGPDYSTVGRTRGGASGGAGYGVAACERKPTQVPGLTEEECERYWELLELRCYYERNRDALLLLLGGADNRAESPLWGVSEGGVSCNESLLRQELALLEEELRHLEFKWRSVLRAHKLQQLRERCLRVWPAEEDEEEGDEEQGAKAGSVGKLTGSKGHRERERSDRESTSAYNTGGESCRSTPLASEANPSPSSSTATMRPRPPYHRGRAEKSQKNTNPCGMDRKSEQTSDGIGSLSHRGGVKRCSDVSARVEGGVKSAENSLSRPRGQTSPPQCHKTSTHLRDTPTKDSQLPRLPEEGPSGLDRDRPKPSPNPLAQPSPYAPNPSSSSFQPADCKSRLRGDGTRYAARRPERERRLRARALRIREERGASTTDEEALSELKTGRYWSREERKRQLARAREQRRRRQLMVQSRLETLGQREGGEAGAVELGQRRSAKKRSRKILDNWITIQELLAHGTRSADGMRVYNPLLSVTTV